MTPLDFSNLAQIIQIASIAKYAFLAILILYVIFAFVVFNQVRVMNRIISTPPVSVILTIISFLHLIIAFSLFLFSLVIL
ncbi:MAG: hypothetical protein A3H79_00595 [Candidatus Levybacteria bacterium RIFCSPLOWO2_02_FULL_36_8b]|nr:MAG: hypothetical protein A3H79_00595 [Candidatus Levybacteria bacterium RIFCSPLOWO2_02_FULL_36_8b]